MVESEIPVFLSLPETLLNKDKDIETSKGLEKDLIGFYFSAHWCPPCRKFTPILAEAYKTWQKEGYSIDIIFVSSDRDLDEFKEYYNEMPWLAIHKNQVDAINFLKSAFKVTGIPKLVILDKEGKLIDGDARNTVANNSAKDAFGKWKQ